MKEIVVVPKIPLSDLVFSLTDDPEHWLCFNIYIETTHTYKVVADD